MTKLSKYQIGQHSFHCSSPNCLAAYNIGDRNHEPICKECGSRGQICKTCLLKCFGECGSTSWVSVPISGQSKKFKCPRCGGDERIISEGREEKIIGKPFLDKYPTGTARSDSRPSKRFVAPGSWSKPNKSSPRAKSKPNKSLPRANRHTEKLSTYVPSVEKGICEDCLKPIGYARLQAQPNTRYCVSCADRYPEGQKNRNVKELWGSRDDWKRDRGGWRKGAK